MTGLPLHATAVVLDGQIRLRVYHRGNLEIEVPLRPRAALILAAQLLNNALIASSAVRLSALDRAVLH
jgi:hypothetical protein